MTYTILGSDPRSGSVGAAIATYSLAVGGYCLGVRADVGAVSSQASVNPALPHLAMSSLESGRVASQVLEEIAEADPFLDYRQVGIVDRQGMVAGHTGAKTRSWSDHISGEGFCAFGNALAGAHVLEAMADTFRTLPTEDLAERLLRSLEAGCNAGGQTGDLAERSAALVVHGTEPISDRSSG